MRIVFLFLISSSIIILSEAPSVYPENLINPVSVHEIGIKGGYPFIAGGLSGHLTGTGSGSIYYIPIVKKDFFLQTSLDLTGYSLTDSSYSYMYSFSLSAVPSYMFYAFSSAGIYSGISLSGNYLYLKADKTDKALYTVKPGVGIDSGIAWRFSSLFSGRLGFSYGFVPLANGSLPNLSVYAGIAYTLSDISETAANEAEAEEFRSIKQADKLYNTGMTLFRERNLPGAKNKFQQAVSAYENHADSEIMLDKIYSYEKDFYNSLKLSKSAQYYEALPLLEKLVPVMKEAETELFRIRTLLLPGVPAMEKEGITAYENRDYEDSIAIMKKISLIDPANSTASIYMPKARKRLEAVKKFR